MFPVILFVHVYLLKLWFRSRFLMLCRIILDPIPPGKKNRGEDPIFFLSNPASDLTLFEMKKDIFIIRNHYLDNFNKMDPQHCFLEGQKANGYLVSKN